MIYELLGKERIERTVEIMDHLKNQIPNGYSIDFIEHGFVYYTPNEEKYHSLDVWYVDKDNFGDSEPLLITSDTFLVKLVILILEKNGYEIKSYNTITDELAPAYNSEYTVGDSQEKR